MKIIVGMHRSGTSIVTRLLHDAGADLGDPKTFYRPDKWNPDGYFEQPEFHAVNMPLINGPFWKLAYFRLPSTATILRRARRFEDRIRAASAKYDDKIVKEVRFCLTLPAWQRYGARFDKIIVCLREPVEVVRSVQRRNRVPAGRVYKLWLQHNQRLLENARGIPLRFVYYKNLLGPDTFPDEVSAALEFFEIEAGPGQIDRLQALMKLPNSRKPEADDVEYPAPVAALWAELLERHRQQFAANDAAPTAQSPAVVGPQ